MENENAVQAGIEIKVIEGMVPLYEEHAARLEYGYTLEVWLGMDVTEKALAIAHRRIRIAMENIQADEQIQSSKKNAKRS